MLWLGVVWLQVDGHPLSVPVSVPSPRPFQPGPHCKHTTHTYPTAPYLWVFVHAEEHGEGDEEVDGVEQRAHAVHAAAVLHQQGVEAQGCPGLAPGLDLEVGTFACHATPNLATIPGSLALNE